MDALAHLVSPYARELTVLLVDDDGPTRLMVGARLRSLFREVLVAEDGQAGLEAFETRRPDLVVTDNRMPRRSGLDMAEAIRATDLRVPILFVTSYMDTPLLLQAINLGIAAFIPKPVALDSLLQALAVAVRELEHDHLQRRTYEQELALLQLRERYHEHQQELAFRKELSILENDFQCRAFGTPGTARGEWLARVVYSPHDIMCGDSYSLRRLADGGLLLFLADAMGKGLAASLTTSLGVHTFNLHADALGPGPFDFPGFAGAFTALMGRRLLEDEVFPMTLAWLPPGDAGLHLAAFGMPPVLATAPGAPVRRLRSGNPPLSPYSGPVRIDRHDLERDRSVLFHTDGLNEAVEPGGVLYREHLDLDFAASLGPGAFWKAFLARVGKPGDDVTVVHLARVDGEPCRREAWTVPPRLEAVEAVCAELEERLEGCSGLEPEARDTFAAAIREAMINAYEHGCLRMPGPLKQRLLEEGTYYQELQAREAAAGGAIEVVLAVQAEGAFRRIKVTIADDGPGFTPPAELFQPGDSLMLCGRGLRMIRKFTDFFYLDERGNRITLVRTYREASHGPGSNGLG